MRLFRAVAALVLAAAAACVAVAGAAADTSASTAAGAAAKSAIPRVLHQIAAPGESLDARVLAAEIRAAHQGAGWQVHAWKQADLLATYADDNVISRVPADRREQFAGAVRRRLSVLVLRDFGGVYVDRNKELVPGRTFDDVLARLHPTTEFFTGMDHPGESARKVLEECDAHALMSDKIKECGKYIPINVGVMGSKRGSRAITDAAGTWYHMTSPAEEIGGASDGQMVLFNWKFFSADTATPDSVVVEREPALARAVASIRERSVQLDGDDGTAAAVLPCDKPIPRVVHQIWISNAKGMQPIPDHIQAMMKVVKDMHEAEGWGYKLWGNELFDIYRDELPENYFTDDRIPAAVIQDHLKILLMRDEGGIFMDVDVEMIHSFGWLFNKLPDDLQFFAGLNFPKPGRRNKVGLRGGPPVSFTVMGCSTCAPTVQGLARVLARDAESGYAFSGSWFWPSRVEQRPDWARPLDNGWGTSLQVTAFMDESARLLNYRHFMDNEASEEAVILHQKHHLWSWFDKFKLYKNYEEDQEKRHGGGGGTAGHAGSTGASARAEAAWRAEQQQRQQQQQQQRGEPPRKQKKKKKKKRAREL